MNCSPYCPLSIGCDEVYIEESVNTKFPGLDIDSQLNWNNHVDEITHKLGGTCYIDRLKFHTPTWIISKEFILYILVVMPYGIILAGDMYYSKDIITLEKRTLIFKV
jgi:hypothetical protein